MAQLFTNNATTTLASGITGVATSLTVSTGTGALFPSPTGADYFLVTLTNLAGNIEIIKCTSRTGDVLTIVRGQEGTTALAWLAGDKVELRITAAFLGSIIDNVNNQNVGGVKTFTSGITFNDSSILPSAAGLKHFNYIRNGNQEVANYGTSATVVAGTAVPTASSGYYTVDGFFMYCTGANVAVAQVASGADKRTRFTGAASVTSIGFGQRMEASETKDLAGKPVTAFIVSSNSLLTQMTWAAYYANTTDTFGTIGTPTKTLIATGTVALTGVEAMIPINFTMPAGATTGIEIIYSVGAQTSGTWNVGKVRLYEGTFIVEPSEPFTQDEVMRCFRFHPYFSGGSGDYVGTGTLYDATSHMLLDIKFITPARVKPSSFIISTASQFTYFDGALNTASISPVGTISTASVNGASITALLNGAGTAGRGGQVSYTVGGGYISFLGCEIP